MFAISFNMRIVAEASDVAISLSSVGYYERSAVNSLTF